MAWTPLGSPTAPTPSARVFFLPAHSLARRVRSCPGSPSSQLSHRAPHPKATLRQPTAHQPHSWAEPSSWNPAAGLAPSPPPTGILSLGHTQPSAPAVCGGLEPGTTTPTPTPLCGRPPAGGCSEDGPGSAAPGKRGHLGEFTPPSCRSANVYCQARRTASCLAGAQHPAWLCRKQQPPGPTRSAS